MAVRKTLKITLENLYITPVVHFKNSRLVFTALFKSENLCHVPHAYTRQQNKLCSPRLSNQTIAHVLLERSKTNIQATKSPTQYRVS